MANMPDERIEVLLVTGGHAYDREPFLAAWQADNGLHVTHVEHPEATDYIASGRASEFDVVVFYDMPGVDPLGPERPTELPLGVREGFELMTKRGTGLVFLHHALASWPAWEGFAELVGGRYNFRPGTLRGVDWPDSGYLHDTSHNISVVDLNHPVTQGVAPTFALRDELYLCAVFDDTSTPLLLSDFEFESSNFYSTSRAAAGFPLDREGWSHPPGSNSVGWSRKQGASRIVYLQPGDGKAAYRDRNLRMLWSNSVRWTARKLSEREGFQ